MIQDEWIFQGRLQGRNVAGGSGTINASTIPADVAKRYAYELKADNEGGTAQILQTKQLRHSGAYTDYTAVPANDGRFFGGNSSAHRILPFDSDATIQVALVAANGTLDVTMGFTDE